MVGHVPFDELTPTQLQILADLGSGLKATEIATTRYMSYSTVQQHIANVKLRTGARTVTGCVMRAQVLGFLTAATGPDALVFVAYEDESRAA